MAQKKKQYGKVEARKSGPLFRFRPSVLLGITVVCFVGCFGLYMVSAASQEDYWEKEIVASLEQEKEHEAAKGHTGKKVVNPVPSSDRADESRMQECAFVGDVGVLTSYYETTSGKVFTDAIVDMPESRMRSIGRSLRGVSPKAVYIWYQPPADMEKGVKDLDDLISNLIDQMPDTPIYLLTATPSTDTEENQRIDTWNASLFATADERGLHYVDISTTLKANSGLLSPTYEKEETLYKTIGDQILTHIAD